MGAIRDKMKADLELRRYAETTKTEYLRRAQNFVAHYGRPLTELGESEIRKFLLHLAPGPGSSPCSVRPPYRVLSTASSWRPGASSCPATPITPSPPS